MINSKIQYLIVGALALITGVAISLMVSSSLKSGHGGGRLDPEGQAIVTRIAETSGGSEYEAKAQARIERGLMTVGDYCVHSLTSPSYLSGNISDETFAYDLAYIITGDHNDPMALEILGDLSSYSRKYVTDKYISAVDSDYAAASDIETTGSSFTDCIVSRSLGDSEGITIGIREVRGSFSVTGDEVRTDFFVDGVLYQGNLRMTETSDGKYDFVMAWDTAGVDTGYHDIRILMRSSDGRGMTAEGGSVYIPSCKTLENTSVVNGSIDAGSSESWYTLDAGENHAFVNFVGLSDDIKVSLYDVYGNVIGTNDLNGSQYEVLRGYRQDVAAVEAETGITGVSNVYYVRVQRGENCGTEDGQVSYTMVQSLNVAGYDGQYYAVLDGVDAVPTPLPLVGRSDLSGTNVRVKGSDGSVIDLIYDDIRFLPLNGFLSEFYIKDAVTGTPLMLSPQFSKTNENYGFYAADTDRITVNAIAQEGYASKVTISNESGEGVFEAIQGQAIDLADGENLLTVSVTSFTGDVKVYTFYILKGDDEGDFAEECLSRFPESYGSGLWLLHNIHPGYVFEPYDTGLDFATVLSNEDNGSRSLASVYTHPNWVKSDSPVYDGGGWMAATDQVVSFFLDPRNFLEPQHLFMFEKLSFDPDVHTVEGVRSIIEGSFMDTDEYDYAQIIYNSGEQANVSPYLLASRIIQEMGYSGQSELCHGTLPGYEGYYNFYNIGSTPDPDIPNGALINGARYAMWGRNPDEQVIDEDEAALMLPWDNVEDAILGGALWIASGYTSVGQNTLYFQKFDMIENDDGLYMHQYAQNISMAYSEGARYFNGYSSQRMLDSRFVFVIPIYDNMPEYYGYCPEPGA